MKKIIFGVILAPLLVIVGLLIFLVITFQSVDACEQYLSTTTSSQSESDPAVTTEFDQAMLECLYSSSDSSGSASEIASGLRRGGLQNGRLPDSMLVTVSTHGRYSCQVANAGGADTAWRELVLAAESEGVDIEGGWCYRTFTEQQSIWSARRCFVSGNCDGNPYPPTAYPGTSNHGWGLAVDVWNTWDTVLSCSDSEFLWMLQNAELYGWSNPDWARCGKASEEPWHWEYVGLGLS